MPGIRWRVVQRRTVHLYGSLFMASREVLRDLVRLDRFLLGGRGALAAFVAASPRLALTSMGLALVGGLLAPSYAIATGALVGAVSSQQSATWPLVALAAIFALQRTLDPIREEIGLALWPRVDEHLNDRIMSAVSKPAGLQELESPAVLDRIAQARGAVVGFTPGQAAQQSHMLIAQRVSALVSLAIVARFYWWAVPGLLAVYAVAYYATRRHFIDVTLVIFGRTEGLRRAHYLRTLALSSHVAKETRVFDLAGWLVSQYRSGSLAVLADVWRKRHEGWRVAVVLAAGVALVEGLVLFIVARDAMAGTLTVGTAVTVAQALLNAGRLGHYEDFDHSLVEAGESIDKVVELEEMTRAKTILSGTRSAAGLPRQWIRFEDVGFAYPSRDGAVFEHFNLEIRAGQSLAIVGENGAGKTTLVKLLTRLYDPTSGRITADGIDLRELDPAEWRRRVSALFQDFARFELSAYDNVAFGALHARTEAAAIRKAAEDAGVLGVVERLAKGWDTTLSREFRAGAELSGGEWQRLALARALFGVSRGAGVLILDEPTASLDVRGEAEIYQRFIELTRGVTTIVISHRFSTVQRADRIVVIKGGRVIEDGTHAELVARPDGRYARMYALQAARFNEPEPADA
jgi:ATP-binding cassette, subfamily B, bacterial